MLNLAQFLVTIFLIMHFAPRVAADDASYQACVDKYSRKGYQPWQEWSDHYTCHRYRCEIRDGKYFIAAVGCRKPKIPENALECHEYIEDENVEFPTCCARLRCVVEVNGDRVVATRGQPGEVFPDKPWKGQTEPSPAIVNPMGAINQNSPAEVGGANNAPIPGMFGRSGGGSNAVSDGPGRRYISPYQNQQIHDSEQSRMKRSVWQKIIYYE